MIDIVLSTRNQSKIDQIKPIFDGLARVRSLQEMGIQGDVVEDGLSLEQNAMKKAVFAALKTGMWCMADDSGFFITALGGKPGIHAARWAGEGATTEDTMRFTLRHLEGVPPERRTAVFTTVAALISPADERQTFTGAVRGRILEQPRTACQPQMPYSAIFVPDGQEKVFAEMSIEEENSLSHRGQAFRHVRDYLMKIIS